MNKSEKIEALTENWRKVAYRFEMTCAIKIILAKHADNDINPFPSKLFISLPAMCAIPIMLLIHIDSKSD